MQSRFIHRLAASSAALLSLSLATAFADEPPVPIEDEDIIPICERGKSLPSECAVTELPWTFAKGTCPPGTLPKIIPGDHFYDCQLPPVAPTVSVACRAESGFASCSASPKQGDLGLTYEWTTSWPGAVHVYIFDESYAELECVGLRSVAVVTVTVRRNGQVVGSDSWGMSCKPSP